MTNSEKRLLWRIIAAALFFALGLVLYLKGLAGPPSALLFFTAYVLVGYDVLFTALRNLRYGQVFDENLLMSLATIGAFLLGEYPEGVAVMLLYQLGEWFHARALSNSRKSIAALMDIRPESANLLLADGTVRTVAPEAVKEGDRIVIRPGERVPLDGVVEEGASSLDVSALTGESLPRDLLCGEEVYSGSINQTGRLTVRVLRPFSESTVAKILELVEEAAEKKSRSERFITRFARYYTPAVVGAALLLALLPPLLLGQPFALWAERALIFLIISCPCALVISVPLSFFGGIGGASKMGILVKGGNDLETLARVELVVFDKTGTLTEGRFVLAGITLAGGSVKTAEELLSLAAAAESISNHPIAQSIVAAYREPIAQARIAQAEELPGLGIRALVDGREILAGSKRLMDQAGISMPARETLGTEIHLAADGSYAGSLRMEDAVKADAAPAIARLRQAGVRRTAMLTGDGVAVGQAVAARLGIDEVRAELLPADKVTQLERLMAAQPGATAYVGDGVNDAPVLARADVGIAMGGLGSDAAVEAADVVIMTDEPSKLADAILIGRKTLSIARQNIAFALGVKALVLLLGALGFASLWAAVFADVGVSVLAVLNAMRTLRIR